MAQNGTAWPQMILKHFPWVYYMIICHVGPPLALFRGPRGPQNGPKQHQKWPFMTKNGPSWPQMALHDPKWPQNTSHGNITWLYVMLDHPRAFSEAHGGSKMAQNSTKMALYYPKWPFMAQYDASMKSLHNPKWLFMTQNVPAWLQMALKHFSGA